MKYYTTWKKHRGAVNYREHGIAAMEANIKA